MRAVLFKKENVYVVIKGQQIDYSNLPNDLIFDYNSSDRCCTCLYGGRVILTGKYNGWHLKIDGLELQHFWLSESNKLPYASDSLDPEMVSAYLNQMENLGVDSFLTNYKNQVQELKKVCNDEIEERHRKADADHDQKILSG